MDVLYLLIPLSVLLVLALIGLFAWSIAHGQFDDLQGEGRRILESDAAALDGDQGSSAAALRESAADPDDQEPRCPP